MVPTGSRPNFVTDPRRNHAPARRRVHPHRFRTLPEAAPATSSTRRFERPRFRLFAFPASPPRWVFRPLPIRRFSRRGPSRASNPAKFDFAVPGVSQGWRNPGQKKGLRNTVGLQIRHPRAIATRRHRFASTRISRWRRPDMPPNTITSLSHQSSIAKSTPCSAHSVPMS